MGLWFGEVAVGKLGSLIVVYVKLSACRMAAENTNPISKLSWYRHLFHFRWFPPGPLIAQGVAIRARILPPKLTEAVYARMDLLVQRNQGQRLRSKGVRSPGRGAVSSH